MCRFPVFETGSADRTAGACHRGPAEPELLPGNGGVPLIVAMACGYLGRGMLQIDPAQRARPATGRTATPSERPVAVTQQPSARYRHWPFRLVDIFRSGDCNTLIAVPIKKPRTYRSAPQGGAAGAIPIKIMYGAAKKTCELPPTTPGNPQEPLVAPLPAAIYGCGSQARRAHRCYWRPCRQCCTSASAASLRSTLMSSMSFCRHGRPLRRRGRSCARWRSL